MIAKWSSNDNRTVKVIYYHRFLYLYLLFDYCMMTKSLFTVVSVTDFCVNSSILNLLYQAFYLSKEILIPYTSHFSGVFNFLVLLFCTELQIFNLITFKYLYQIKIFIIHRLAYWIVMNVHTRSFFFPFKIKNEWPICFKESIGTSWEYLNDIPSLQSFTIHNIYLNIQNISIKNI